MLEIVRMHTVWTPTSLLTMTRGSQTAHAEERHAVFRVVHSLNHICIKYLRAAHPVKCTFLGRWANNPFLLSRLDPHAGHASLMTIAPVGLPACGAVFDQQ